METIRLYVLKCLRCGLSWNSKDKQPKRCGKCKTPYWNVPKRK